ncbi:MAG: PQQ-dependent sugar dehydrogenase [Calditrichia bacterium]
MKMKILLFSLTCLFLQHVSVYAQYQIIQAFPNLPSFTRPVDLQNSGDGSNRIYVVEQRGMIYVFANDSNVTQRKVFLDIRGRVDDSGNEMGLLGLAFHPDYENNGYFYVDYTAGNPRRTVISRFSVSTANPDSADENSELILLTVNQPYSNHNGGQIAFGPDNMLYISLGDGGLFDDPQNNGQNRATLLGSLLRIDVDTTSGNLNYAIPPDNPFVGNPNGYREEIYAFGLRNPWRFSFDHVTAQLWAGDVGQDHWEEVDIIRSGGNYGWRKMEGFHCYIPPSCDTSGQNIINPVWEYGHNLGVSITGGYVYRGPGVPELTGKYIYSDYGSGRIWALEYDGVNSTNSLLIDTNKNISSFGVDENNELYICSFDGKIYRFKPIVTSLEDSKSYLDPIPQYFELEQNYPNPFNPETTIPFVLHKAGLVEVRVFDVSGNHIKTLLNEHLTPGEFRVVWDGSDEAGAPQPSGIYFYKLTVNNRFSDIKRMILVK